MECVAHRVYHDRETGDFSLVHAPTTMDAEIREAVRTGADVTKLNAELCKPRQNKPKAWKLWVVTSNVDRYIKADGVSARNKKEATQRVASTLGVPQETLVAKLCTPICISR